MYNLFLEHGAEVPVVLTNPITQHMDFAETMILNRSRFGFSWLGVGSFISRRSAEHFLNNLTRFIPDKFMLHADIFFTMYSKTVPLVLAAEVTPLSRNNFKKR
mgnify:CR=1 FL=1